jgi:hypothetical protein
MRVHIDLWGPARTESLGGAQYLMQCADSGSAMKHVFPLNNKSSHTVTNTFAAYHILAEKQMGQTLQIVHVDLCREFDNADFLGYCQDHGITVEKVPKALSAANGHVECGNRTIVEGACTQLLDAAMSHGFWAESAVAHTYVQSFIPSSCHPDKVPRQTWYGTDAKPSIAHL